jgi:hypothetical protein
MKAYVYQSSGIPNYSCRTIHRNTTLKEELDPEAEVSEDLGAALFEISETTRKKGLRPRHVVLARVNPDTGFRLGGVKKVAISTQARWEEISPAEEFTIDGATYKVIRKVAEEIGV